MFNTVLVSLFIRIVLYFTTKGVQPSGDQQWGNQAASTGSAWGSSSGGGGFKSGFGDSSRGGRGRGRPSGIHFLNFE